MIKTRYMKVAKTISETVFLPVAGWQQRGFTVRIRGMKFLVGAFRRNIVLFVSLCVRKAVCQLCLCYLIVSDVVDGHKKAAAVPVR